MDCPICKENVTVTTRTVYDHVNNERRIYTECPVCGHIFSVEHLKIVEYMRPDLFGYTNVFYVSVDGDDEYDGLSWDSPVETLSRALELAEDSAFPLIMVGIGTFDINTATGLEIDSQVTIRGLDKFLTIITNTHASATHVLHFTASFRLERLNVSVYRGIGVHVDGMGAQRSSFDEVLIGGINATVLHTLLKLEDTFSFDMRNSSIIGELTKVFSTGIEIVNTGYSGFGDNICFFCATGISIDSTSKALDIVDHRFLSNAVGISIATGATDVVFDEIDFVANTVNITDNVGAYVTDIKTGCDVITSIAPDNITGITLTAGVGAGVWGNNITIRSGVGSTKPFYVTGIIWEQSLREKFGLRLTCNDGSTYFWNGIVETGSNNCQRIRIGPILHVAGDTIKGSVRSETGSNTMLIWLNIEEI